MATYKISGHTSKEAVIYIIQDEEYKGKRRVSSGNYELIFESNSNSPVVAVAENIDGQIMSFGNIILLNAESGESPNLHKTSVVQEVTSSLHIIREYLINVNEVPSELIDELEKDILSLKSI